MKNTHEVLSCFRTRCVRRNRPGVLFIGAWWYMVAWIRGEPFRNTKEGPYTAGRISAFDWRMSGPPVETVEVSFVAGPIRPHFVLTNCCPNVKFRKALFNKTWTRFSTNG